MVRNNNGLLVLVLSSFGSLVSLIVLLKVIGAGRSLAVIVMAGLGFVIFLSLLIGVLVSMVRT